MKFLLAQINPVVGDLEGNAKKILCTASKASSTSADLVLTPELSLWGYPANDLLLKKNLLKTLFQILGFEHFYFWFIGISKINIIYFFRKVISLKFIF